MEKKLLFISNKQCKKIEKKYFLAKISKNWIFMNISNKNFEIIKTFASFDIFEIKNFENFEIFKLTKVFEISKFYFEIFEMFNFENIKTCQKF